MLENGSRYVISSADTLYYLPNSSCSEGSSVNLQGESVTRYRLINNNWYAQDNVTISNYNNYPFICHVYDSSKDFFNHEAGVLPAVLIVLCLFSCIFHWFLRLRG